MSKEQLNYQKSIIYGIEELDRVVDELLGLMPITQVFSFTGSLGAGKTTLVRALLAQCGIVEPVTSPTFNYVNLYVNNHGQRFYHFDLYRIGSLEAFYAAGFDEYLFQPNSWSFIEWPEVIAPLLTHDTCQVALSYDDERRKAGIRCN